MFACKDGKVYIVRNTDGMGTFSRHRKAVVATSSLTYATSLCLGDMTNDGLTDLIVIGGTASWRHGLCVGYNAAANAGSPSFSNVFGYLDIFVQLWPTLPRPTSPSATT